MKATIHCKDVPFGDWTFTRWELHVLFGRKEENKTAKVFLLGQDAKFSDRALGYELSYLFEKLNIPYKRKITQRNKRRLANFIIKELGLTTRILRKLEPWSLSAE